MTALFAAGISQREACRSTSTSRASWNRWRKKATSLQSPARFRIVRSGAQPHALSVQERQAVLAICNSERFCNSAPRAIVATLLDEAQYLGSASTFYRILRAAGQSRERRAIAVHPTRIKPELVATTPNELWSWDVTKLPGPAKWTWYSLYLILDVFSRYIIDWTVASVESAAIAKALFSEAAHEQSIKPGQLHVHADGGAAMKAKSLALLFADLGISKSHSRPHVSNDNPFSEAQFKTLKYRPEFPDFFPSVEAARAFMVDFVRWYNHEHRHSGLAFLTPADVHFGRAHQILAQRNAAMQLAWHRYPRRFHCGGPAMRALPNAVYINRPTPDDVDKTAGDHALCKSITTEQTTNKIYA
jgi:putative transposase